METKAARERAAFCCGVPGPQTLHIEHQFASSEAFHPACTLHRDRPSKNCACTLGRRDRRCTHRVRLREGTRHRDFATAESLYSALIGGLAATRLLARAIV